MIKYFVRNPTSVFLLDSLGALITAFLLFVVFRNFNEYVAIPEKMLTTLSVIAIFFSIYSMICFLILKKHFAFFIRIIGFANLLYCLLTIVLIIIYRSTITHLGITYFLVETTFIVGLVWAECKVAAQIKRNSLKETS